MALLVTLKVVFFISFIGISRFIVATGNTQIIASASGPLVVKLRDEIIDRATVEVLVKSLSGSASMPTKRSNCPVTLLFCF
jgi:hypothetical protein